jgi:hypothetical protein
MATVLPQNPECWAAQFGRATHACDTFLPQSLEGWATVVMAAATVVGLIAVWIQIRHSEKIDKQAAARQLYAVFLEYAARHPESVDTDEVRPGSQYDWAMYLWLTALESGWFAFDRNSEWRKRIASCARQNRAFFESDYWLGKAEFVNSNVKQDFDRKFTHEVERAVSEEKKREGKNAFA